VSGVPYHGWTHRPKALGGTDPTENHLFEAAFWFALPVHDDALGQQRLETARDWTPLTIDPDYAYNFDKLTNDVAVDVVAMVGGGDKLVVRTAHPYLENLAGWQYWIVGATVNIGSFFDTEGPAAPNWMEWWDSAAEVRAHQLAIQINSGATVFGFDSGVSETILTREDGGYYVSDCEGRVHRLHTSRPLNPSEVNYAEDLDPEDRQGVYLQAWHSVDWVDDDANLKGPPAVNGGAIWGFRYAIGAEANFVATPP
jgi:hypothetical protein